jgi:hypothetical protein
MQGMPGLDELFERRQTYPDFEPQERLARLVGLDDQKSRLAKILGLLVNPQGLEQWASKFVTGDARPMLDAVLRRPPLVISQATSAPARLSLQKPSETRSPAGKDRAPPCIPSVLRHADRVAWAK